MPTNFTSNQEHRAASVRVGMEDLVEPLDPNSYLSSRAEVSTPADEIVLLTFIPRDYLHAG
jgi:hypothetical protein